MRTSYVRSPHLSMLAAHECMIQTRQLNAMNEEERAKKLEQVAKRQEELEFRARVQAAYRELKLAKSRASM